MNFSITQLLDNFADDKLVLPKTLEKKLGIADDADSIARLQVTLDALEKIGILIQEKGRYRRVHEDGVVEGRLRCSSKGFCFAIQDAEEAEDVYIRESRLSHAWNGDRVLVRVTKDGMRRRSPEGEVRLILERSNPTLLSTVRSKENGYCGIPLDDRLLFEVELEPSEDVPDLALAVDKLVHLEILRYPLGNHLPKGQILQILGDDAEGTNDIDLVCCKHNLPRRFSARAMTAAASLPRGVRKADLKHRLDLRKTLTVRISNAAAISLTETATGWDLGVHIPDVATYVTENSPMDVEARQRLRSFFLGDVVLPMLPEMNVFNQPEYLTISVLVKLDPLGQVQSFEIQPSAIAVRANLSYQRAEQIWEGIEEAVDEDAPSQEIGQDVVDLVRQIGVLGKRLYQYRQGLHVTLPQASLITHAAPDEGFLGVPLVPFGQPISGMVAEIMILANQLIASHLHALAVPAPYLRHALPDQNKLEDWLKLLDSLGISTPISDAAQISIHEINQLLQQINGLEQTTTKEILLYLLTSMFQPHEFSFTPGTHFGLGLDANSPYTHGVCPQHHYSDLLVQRILHTVLEQGRDRRTSRAKDAVNLRSSHCHGQINWNVLPPEDEENLKDALNFVMAKLTQQDALCHRAVSDLEGLRKSEFMRSHTGDNFHGIITSVQTYGFFVEIENLLVEGLVHVSSLKDDWYEFPQTGGKGRSRASTLLVGRRSGRQYCLGDRVEVQIKGVDYYRQQIDLVAVISSEGDGAVSDETQPPSAELVDTETEDLQLAQSEGLEE